MGDIKINPYLDTSQNPKNNEEILKVARGKKLLTKDQHLNSQQTFISNKRSQFTSGASSK